MQKDDTTNTVYIHTYSYYSWYIYSDIKTTLVNID